MTQPKDSDLVAPLMDRERELNGQLVELHQQISKIQGKAADVQRELGIVRSLLQIYHSDASSKTFGMELEYLESIKGIDPNSFEGSIKSILTKAGEPMNINMIENELRSKNIPIPGKGTRANIITRITRANDMFVRVGSGRYALKEWGWKPIKTKRNKRK